MITLHPRTSKQRFTGKADWSLIKELKKYGINSNNWEWRP